MLGFGRPVKHGQPYRRQLVLLPEICRAGRGFEGLEQGVGSINGAN